MAKYTALRPPMGWNSYDYYDTNVTEADVLANARYMAEHLKPYGWEYVVVDIQWYAYDTASMRDRFQYIPFGRVEMDGFGRLFHVRTNSHPVSTAPALSPWQIRSMLWV